MTDRCYTILDVPVMDRLWSDLDLIVRLLEYVRQNLRSFGSEMPVEYELDLLAAGTAHNIDEIPLIGVYSPESTTGAVLNWLALQEVINHWCDRHSDEELRVIAGSVSAPTWSELTSLGVYPARR